MSRIFVIIAVFIHLPLSGWFDAGHLLVTQVAYEQMSPGVRQQVDEIASTLSEHFPNTSNFVTSSLWADDIKSGDNLHCFDSWHYTDIPYDVDEVLTPNARAIVAAQHTQNDVIFAVNQARKTLRSDKSSPFAKALMLNMLTHCVGDIHQPLHTVSRYSHRHPQGDRGGNLHNIRGAHQHNLHFLWDDGLGDFPSSHDREGIERYARELIERYPASSFPRLKDKDPRKWALESYDFAVNDVYTLEPGGTPTAEYLERGREVCRQRITLAGYRLALMLERMFKDKEVSGVTTKERPFRYER